MSTVRYPDVVVRIDDGLIWFETVAIVQQALCQDGAPSDELTLFVREAVAGEDDLAAVCRRWVTIE